MSETPADRYAYRPGLIFLSPSPGHVEGLWPERYHVYPDGTREIIEPPGAADFEMGITAGPEFIPVDNEGNEQDARNPVLGMEALSIENKHADIRGGAFDLDYAADRLGWTDEQRATAAAKLLRKAHDPTFRWVTLYEPATPTPPWPTYDKLTNYLEIAKLAESLGLLGEAIAYERYTKNRDGVLTELIKRRDELAAEETLTAA